MNIQRIQTKKDGQWQDADISKAKHDNQWKNTGSIFVKHNGQWLTKNIGLVSYITINQNLTDPATMITGDINGPAIQWIRNNSHRYLGKYTGPGAMSVCQLDDTNSNNYKDGSTAGLTGGEGDVFMKLPKFFYKAEETSPDVWKIGFSNYSVDSTWKEWDGKDLIGVYKCVADKSKIASLSNRETTNDFVHSDLKSFARNRGDGYTLVKYKHQNIMAFLFYAFYGNTNSQAICGPGVYDYDKITGETDLLGMADTKTETAGNNTSINFWGLEGWWGSKHEFLDNVVVNTMPNNGVWRVMEDDGSTRDIQGTVGANVVSKMIIGDNLDTVAKEYGVSLTASFCDYQQMGDLGNNSAVMRYGGDSAPSSGVASLYVISTSYLDNRSGSRLAFRGEITEITNTEEFKNIPIIN